MAAIEPEGLPGVELAPLRALRSRAALSDEAMVQAHRAHLLDPAAPSPSVEDPAPRVPAAHVHRPYPRQCGAGGHQPARRGRAGPGNLGGPRRHRALRDARISARQGLRRRLRGRAGGRGAHPAGARDLHIRPDGANRLRPHDRAGERRRACARGAAAVGATRPVATADRSRGDRSRAGAAGPPLPGPGSRPGRAPGAPAGARAPLECPRAVACGPSGSRHGAGDARPRAQDQAAPPGHPARGRAAGTPGFRCSASSAFAAYTDCYRPISGPMQDGPTDR